jgi:catechol 2,3-dioxygenase-like lactoylglutathione lyase family enzyme
MRVTGPVLDAPDVAELARFYSELLGWPIVDQAGPRPGHPPGDGWAMLRPEDRTTKIEIQFEEHFIPPVWPAAPGQPSMQLHLDIEVEDVEAAIAWAEHCGARHAASQPEGRDPARLRIMIDPAGHPFCLWS